MYDEESSDEFSDVREFSAGQRRVLGVLIEKGLTTPEYYPLTLKAATTGSNQKSNRSPVVSYDEDFVEETLDKLKEMGFVGVLHPDSGRALRYRHYVRKRFSFSEPQIAIMAELLLRGRQTLGELRSRASRMVSIEGLDTLRQELRGLLDGGFIRASGSLERRGVEVDHNFYRDNETRGEMPTLPAEEPSPAPAGTPSPESVAARPATPVMQTVNTEHLEKQISELRSQNGELKDEVDQLKSTVEALQNRLDDICRDLGI